MTQRQIDMPDVKHVVLSEPWDNQHAIIVARELAADAGFSSIDQAMISTAASELSTNILRYAGKGEMFLRIIRSVERIGIEIVAVDKGPGIHNLTKAMEDSYSTTKGSLGLGLPSVKRIMDDFSIQSSPEQGTRITSCKWRKHGKS